MRRILLTIAATLAGLLTMAPPSSAYDSDALVARMRKEVPTIAPEENKVSTDARAQGIRAVTLIWHEEPETEQVTLECYRNDDPPQLTAQWNGVKPPAVFWQLVGTLGGIASDVPPSVMRDTAKANCAKALRSTGPTGGFAVEGVHFDCQAWREKRPRMRAGTAIMPIALIEIFGQ